MLSAALLCSILIPLEGCGTQEEVAGKAPVAAEANNAQVC